MNKLFLILRHEFIQTITRRTYLLFSFGIPIVLLIIFAAARTLGSRNPDLQNAAPDQETQVKTQGYIDESGIIQSLPRDVSDVQLKRFSAEDQALKAIEDGEIEGFYIVPDDYVQTGDLTYVRPNYTPLSSDTPHWIMRWTLLFNLLDGNYDRAQQVWNPADLQITSIQTSPEGEVVGAEDCSSPGYRCNSNPLVQMLPFGVVILFFLFLTSGSGQLIRSVAAEKENRMMEVLILSSDPRQMLAGKIIGLGITSLLQVVVWLGGLYIMITTGGQTLNLPPEFSLPRNLLLWLIVFFLLGYVIYASLMAAAGTLVPSIKEITSATWLMMLPLLVGYFVAITPIGLEDPHGALVTVLSLFPLTSPVVMVMRLTVGGVPTWQLLSAIALSLLSAVLVVNASARLFRAQTLLSGESFQVRRFLKALLQPQSL